MTSRRRKPPEEGAIDQDWLDDALDEVTHERAHGENPPGLGPDVFRERLDQVRRDDAEGEHGAHIVLDEEVLYLEDIEGVEVDDDHGHGGNRSRIRLRNGVIIGGLTGAAIVAALATVRYRRRHH